MLPRTSTLRAACLLILSLTTACSDGPVCGDGLVTGSENCDDSNTLNGDGCNAICLAESGWNCGDGTICDPVCGDGMVVAAEVCDPTNSAWTEYCASDCTTTIASCGDTLIQTAHEACDDGNASAADGCNSSCQPSYGWTCDAGGACDASSVDPATRFADMTNSEKTQLCNWMNVFLDGTGRSHRCGGLIYTVNSVVDCVAAISGGGECTVGDFEAWTAERSGACDFFESMAPVC